MKKNVAIDIDGILTLEDLVKDWWSMTPSETIPLYRSAKPNLENIGLVRGLYKSGYEIRLYTSRDHAYKPVTAAWLKKYKVPYHEINFNKLFYDAFLDDKATNSPEELLRMLHG